MRKTKPTRGRKSDDDRVYPTTTGNFEVSAATLSELLEECELNLAPDAQDELLAQINWRITHTRNPNLTWGDVKASAQELSVHAIGLRDAIQEISATGQSKMSLPHGWHLLNDIDFDFNHGRVGKPTNWHDVVEWLEFISEQFEARFVDLGGRADPYREFIRVCRDILKDAGSLKAANQNHRLTVLLVALEGRFPNLAFPEGTIGNARYEYVRNALRAEKS